MPISMAGLDLPPTEPQKQRYKSMMEALKPIDMLKDAEQLESQHAGNANAALAMSAGKLPAMMMIQGQTPVTSIITGNILAVHNNLPLITGKASLPGTGI